MSKQNNTDTQTRNHQQLIHSLFSRFVSKRPASETASAADVAAEVCDDDASSSVRSRLVSSRKKPRHQQQQQQQDEDNERYDVFSGDNIEPMWLFEKIVVCCLMSICLWFLFSTVERL